MITVRIAEPEDAPFIADLSRQTFFETFASQNSKENMDKFMDRSFTRDALINEVTEPGNIFLLAFDQDKPVGYARMRENNNPPELGAGNVIEISRIYAVKDSIGRGVGKALMQKCIEMAVEKNKEALWLGVWKENRVAIAFYEKWGFTKFAEHIFMLGDDPQQDWLMKKIIKPV